MNNADFDINDGARVLIVVLAVACLVMMLVLFVRRTRRHDMDFGDAIIRLGVMALLAAMAFSTLEVLLGWHTQVRVWVLLGALVWMCVGLSWSMRHDKWKKR